MKIDFCLAKSGLSEGVIGTTGVELTASESGVHISFNLNGAPLELSLTDSQAVLFAQYIERATIRHLITKATSGEFS